MTVQLSLLAADEARPPSRRDFKRAKLKRLASALLPQWELDDAVTVVLFAGLGGACQGLEEAGCPVNVASNHDGVALAAHAALHPHTRHIKGDIFDVDPLIATGGKMVKALWASPDCTDHSVAKGGAPRSGRVRALPWQVCRWAAKTLPTVIFVENVREIRGWGPLIAKRCKTTGRVIKLDGSVAAKGEQVTLKQQQLVRDKARLGHTFRAWVNHMRALGYNYEDRDLNAADYGVPTARRRFFAVMRRDRQPIRWPERTHAPRAVAGSLGLLPWAAAATIIDWSIPLRSIFGRKKPLAEPTHRRIALGLKRYVLDSASPFLLPVTHTGGDRVHDIQEPLRTITTAHRGEIALIAPHVTKFHAGQIGTNLVDPLPTVTSNGHNKRPGGAIPLGIAGACLTRYHGQRREGDVRGVDLHDPLPTQTTENRFGAVGAWMVQHNLGLIGHALAEPISTLTTAGSQQQVAGAYLAKLRGTSTAVDAGAPCPTLSAGGNHIAAVAAFLTKYYGTGGQDQDATDPLHTLSTKGRFGVVNVMISGEPYTICDIGMRMLEPHEAAAAHELALPKQITIDGKTRPLTKTEAMRLIGNSVPKRIARLLAQANSAHALYAPRPDMMAAD